MSDNLVLWNTCYLALHVKCNWEEIIEKQNVQESLKLVSTLLKSITDGSEMVSADLHIQDFNRDIKNFSDELFMIQEKVIRFFTRKHYII